MEITWKQELSNLYSSNPLLGGKVLLHIYFLITENYSVTLHVKGSLYPWEKLADFSTLEQAKTFSELWLAAATSQKTAYPNIKEIIEYVQQKE